MSESAPATCCGVTLHVDRHVGAICGRCGLTMRPGPRFREGDAVRRKSDGRLGIVRNAWTQDDGSERVFVQASGEERFLSAGMLGEPASTYEPVTP